MKRKEETKKRAVLLALVAIAVVGMTAVLPGLASADPTKGFIYRANPPIWFTHRDATPWLFLLDQNDNCLSTIPWTAGTDFVVMQGYSAAAYDKNPIPMYPDLMDPTTMFQLYVDGTLMHAAEKVWVQAMATDAGNWWFVLKFYETTFKGGMTGTHLFTGVWYHLGVLDMSCPVTVTFT